MGMIGIIGAMEQEVEILKSKMDIEKTVNQASMEFCVGSLHGRQVVVVKSGIGKVNAGLCTQILVNLFAVEAVINTGIAGSLQNQVNIGDIIVSEDALQHDVDARVFGYAAGEIPDMGIVAFPADKSLMQMAVAACKTANPDIGVFTGRIVTGDQFISDDGVKDRLKNEFKGFCTEMEGAAIAQAAYLNKIPYVVIRAISDKADGSAEVDYPTFEMKAIRHCSGLVEEMIRRYPS